MVTKSVEFYFNISKLKNPLIRSATNSSLCAYTVPSNALFSKKGCQNPTAQLKVFFSMYFFLFIMGKKISPVRKKF